MLKGQKGITLVALVITIIVMLILAGVSISLVLGQNGVLTQASSAVYKTNIGKLQEDLSVVIAALNSEDLGRWAENPGITRGGEFTMARINNDLKGSAGFTSSDTVNAGDAKYNCLQIVSIDPTPTGGTLSETQSPYTLTLQYGEGGFYTAELTNINNSLSARDFKEATAPAP